MRRPVRSRPYRRIRATTHPRPTPVHDDHDTRHRMRRKRLWRRRPEPTTLGAMTEFRFSVNIFEVGSPDGFARWCRAAEDAGFDAVYAADHLGVPAPFPVL